ncbi:ATP synthase subunit delta, mitochondrial-like [Oscarella lobularis]|uniref:ATP synthase subunit delta, mitochondrial-like n=1 Tax=Oscarella lobularis TaxID=121494 RepID=UPI0033137A27
MATSSSLRVLRRFLAPARLLAVPRRGLADAEASSGSTFPLTFSGPHSAFYNSAPVAQVDVPATSGNFGIRPNHVPVLAVLKPGVVTVMEDTKQSKYFVSSGTVTVNGDASVQIIAEEAAPLDHFDIQAARQGLEQCQQRTSSSSSDEDKTEAMIGAEVYEALVKALE